MGEPEYLGRCVLCGVRITSFLEEGDDTRYYTRTLALVPTPGPRPPHFTTSKPVIVAWCGDCWDFVAEKAALRAPLCY